MALDEAASYTWHYENGLGVPKKEFSLLSNG
jgi:hypothetical protein